jgi:hypothetical protein
MLASKVDVRPPVARHLKARPLPDARPGIQERKRGVRPALVHEHKAPRVDPSGDHHPPGGPEPFVAFARSGDGNNTATADSASGVDRSDSGSFQCESFLRVVRDDQGALRTQYRDDELIV